MRINKVWAIPNKSIFECLPIKNFLVRYLSMSKDSIDPFAADSTLTNYRNDPNPNSSAPYHMKALEFLKMLRLTHKSLHSNLVLFNPPYLLCRFKERYESVGLHYGQKDEWELNRWVVERDVIKDLVTLGGFVLNFGQTTNRMGRKRGFQIEELLVISYNGAHKDTLCIAEKKIKHTYYSEEI